MPLLSTLGAGSIRGFGGTVSSGGAGLENVEYLIVGGGGSGGAGNFTGSAGGGAGGLRTSVVGATSGGGGSPEPRITLEDGVTYTITVGNGGKPYDYDTSYGRKGQDGGDSSIVGGSISIVSVGGGGGAGYDNSNDPGSGGSDGGSGGGGGSQGENQSAGSGTANQGYAGAVGRNSSPENYPGGGGGGAGATGNNSQALYSSGGAGIQNNIDGNNYYYAGGGGGTGYNTRGGNGGAGGGGAGNSCAGSGIASGGGSARNSGEDGGYSSGGPNGSGKNAGKAGDNTGGGGGGYQTGSSYYANGSRASEGGTGIVIIRYPTAGAPDVNGGIITTNGGYTIHTFTSSGFLTVGSSHSTQGTGGSNFKLPFDSHMSDVSTLGYSGSAGGGGSVQLTAIEKKIGDRSLQISSNPGWIDFPSAAGNLGSSNWTIDFWLKTTTGADGQGILTQAVAGGAANTSWGFFCGYGSSYNLAFYMSNASSYFASVTSGTTNICTGNWVHCAASRSGSTVYLFADGQSQGTASVGSTAFALGNLPVRVGAQSPSYSLPTNSYIDDIRIVKGSALYTSNFTPPTGPTV